MKQLTYPQLFYPKNSQQTIKLKPLESNQIPAKQNPEEDYFYWYYLNKFFPDLIHRNYCFQEYYPDFIYVDEEAGLYIDIECDEPYVYQNAEPTHYRELDSEKQRNLTFINSGWFVIRFAEEQIVRYPESCCKYIAEIIANLTENYSLLEQFNHVSELPTINHWTKLEAKSLAKIKHRDSYLNTAYNYSLPESRKDFINSLKSFVNVESDTQVREIKETWALAINERVEQGKAISNLEIINQSDKQITVKFQENLSKFALGDELLFNSGNPFNNENKYQCTLEAERDNLLVLSFKQKIDLLPEDFKQKWVLDLQLLDLRSILLKTLNNIEYDVNLQNKIIDIIEGKVKPDLGIDSKNIKFDLNYLEQLGLTPKQQEALINALTTNNYYLIQGPPGTGKTWLLAHLAYILAQQGQTVLITAFTHTAINNALKKIVEVTGYNKIIKVGKADKSIDLTWENHSISNYEYLNNSPYKNDTKGLIIGATCYTVGGNRLKGIEFDTIIFDEAGQITLPVAIKGMTGGSKYIFIGDHQQMSPVIAGVHRQSWVTHSIFETLFNYAQGTMLDITHRLNQEINEFPSQYFYQGLLQPSPEAMSRKLELPIPPQVYDDVLNPEISSVFVEVNHQGQGLNSPQEAEIIAEIVGETVKCGVSSHEIAIVVPYRSQARLIRQKLQQIASEYNLPDVTSVLVNTVESMQGQERDIMIVSLTTSDPFHATQKADFYFQPNRLNVAITRARVKRIVVGSPDVFKAEPEQPEHKKWVSCFRSFYKSNHRISIPQPRGLNMSEIDKNLEGNKTVEITNKMITIADLAQYIQNLSTSFNKAELITNFAPLLLEVLGFSKQQIKQKNSTGNGKEIVDFTIYQVNEQQKNIPFLLCSIEDINLDFNADNPQYQARVNNLKKDLLAPNFKTVQWGLISNGKQIQLFRKHGKVIYPASLVEELNPNNLEEFEEKITRIKTQIEHTPKALTVAIYNNKGGVGKTTTTINLAGILSLLKYKVLVIDFDCNQQDLSSVLGITSTKVTLYHALKSKDNLIKKTIASYREEVGKQKYLFSFDVIPSDQYLANKVDERDLFQMMEVSRLRQLLEPLKNEYDYILIDNPPNWRFFSQSGLCASDVVLIPTQHNDINSIQNAVTVIKDYIPEIQNYRQLSQPVALPIFFNKGQITQAQLRTTYDTIDKIIKQNRPELDLLSYFYPQSNEYQWIKNIYHLGEYAYIANANFLQKPAVYKYQKVYDIYKNFVKEYFI